MYRIPNEFLQILNRNVNRKERHKGMDKRFKCIVLAVDGIYLAILFLYSATSRLTEGLPMIKFHEQKWEEITVEESFYNKSLPEAVSPPRIIKESVLHRKKVYNLSKEDYENLLRIVEAEATGEDLKGKILVANVVMNRMKSGKFPSTVTGVVFQKDMGTVQFSPVADGRFYTVHITDSTKEAVEEVLYGIDYSQGALYFVAAPKANQENYAWFKGSLDYLFCHGGHEFYR